MEARRYRYVGPDEIRIALVGAPGGLLAASVAALVVWLRDQPSRHGRITATYVVDGAGVLRVASRNSEHVACAEGAEVLAAGEVVFELDEAGLPEVVDVSNQSTGYCPEPACWSAVEAALERIPVEHPGGFTASFLFRRCPACGQRNVVKDDWFVCAVCGGKLPLSWNF